MRIRLLLPVLVLCITATASAQHDERPQWSLYYEGSTSSGSYAVLDNSGFGGAWDAHSLPNAYLRFSTSYNRAATGVNIAPYQFLSGAADVVIYPIASARVRVYALGGIGFSHQLAHSQVGTVRGLTQTTTTPADNYFGVDAGLGVEFGTLFLQYRFPPRPRVIDALDSHFNYISLGLRF